MWPHCSAGPAYGHRTNYVAIVLIILVAVLCSAAFGFTTLNKSGGITWSHPMRLSTGSTSLRSQEGIGRENPVTVRRTVATANACGQGDFCFRRGQTGDLQHLHAAPAASASAATAAADPVVGLFLARQFSFLNWPIICFRIANLVAVFPFIRGTKALRKFVRVETIWRNETNPVHSLKRFVSLCAVRCRGRAFLLLRYMNNIACCSITQWDDVLVYRNETVTK